MEIFFAGVWPKVLVILSGLLSFAQWVIALCIAGFIIGAVGGAVYVAWFALVHYRSPGAKQPSTQPQPNEWLPSDTDNHLAILRLQEQRDERAPGAR